MQRLFDGVGMDGTNVAESIESASSTRGPWLYTGTMIALGVFFLGLALFRPSVDGVCVEASVVLHPVSQETTELGRSFVAPGSSGDVDSSAAVDAADSVQRLKAALAHDDLVCEALKRSGILDEPSADSEAAVQLAREFRAAICLDAVGAPENRELRLRWTLPVTEPWARAERVAQAADALLAPFNEQRVVQTAGRILEAYRQLQEGFATTGGDAEPAERQIEEFAERIGLEAMPDFWVQWEQPPTVTAGRRRPMTASGLLLLMGPALAVGALGAFWRRVAHPPETFYSPQDVGDWLELPVLGAITTDDGPEIELPRPPQSPAIVSWFRAACELIVLFSVLLVVVCAATVANYSSMLLEDPFAAFQWAVDYVWSARPW